ncbi:MAG: FKBP-type peptidyl-prolyl cis-trans isomerase [Myxococcota bacterium]|jgi:FKBP-type peptidyl-prolyl cis-trans isomerase FklB|nr:FKBP-type peptidyl-prolyl cis-trans isomerase [Myxococcota bacterium]
MRRIFAISSLAATSGILALFMIGQASAGTTDSLDSEEKKEAYSLGVVVATQAMVGLGEVDSEAFLAGVSDAVEKSKLALEENQITEALTRFDTRRAEEARVAVEALINTNRGAGDAFRENFAEDPDVETLANGLQYKVLKAGEGESPAGDSTVTLHYRGSLVDGREIDSSYARNEPVTIQVDQAIQGWSEALTRMAVGSKWQLVVPPELAYGDNGAGSLIEPGSTVIFEMELISKS